MALPICVKNLWIQERYALQAGEKHRFSYCPQKLDKAGVFLFLNWFKMVHITIFKFNTTWYQTMNNDKNLKIGRIFGLFWFLSFIIIIFNYFIVLNYMV